MISTVPVCVVAFRGISWGLEGGDCVLFCFVSACCC